MPVRALASLICCSLLLACTPADPLDQPIEAATALAFDQWSYRQLGRLAEPVRTELREARQQLLLDVQLRQAGLSPAEQHATVLAFLHQRTPRQVIVHGHQLHLARLRTAQAADRLLLDANQARILDPRLSPEVAASLAARLSPIVNRQKDRELQIAALLARLAELGHPAEAPAAPPRPEAPPARKITGDPLRSL